MAEHLTTARLIDLWDTGRNYPPYKSALLLVSATTAESERAGLGDWTIGQRDRHLLELRQKLFGDNMACVARCPECSEQVEFNLSVHDFLALEAKDAQPYQFDYKDHTVTFRLPTIADLEGAMTHADPQQVLLERSIISIEGDEKDDAVLSDILAQLTKQIDEIDPIANIQLELACGECGTQWQSVFDIINYLWREIGAWATRILGEVHVIASAYGWSEESILNLSANRRQTYLDLILGTS